MKKLIALLLVLAMTATLCLVSCDDGGSKPPIGPSDDTGNSPLPGGDTAGDGGDENPEDTKQPEEKVYEPDPDADFSGYFAVAGEGGDVYFDDFKAVGVRGKITMIDDNLEEAADLSAYTNLGDAAVWTLETIETTTGEGDKAETTVNKAVKTTGAYADMLQFGGKDWNMMQFSMKVKLAEGTSAKIYVGVQDENNWYALTVGSTIKVEHCENGTVSVDTMELPFKPTYDTFFPVSVVQDAATFKCFVAGTQYFEAYKPVDPEDEYVGGIGFGTWSTDWSVDNVKVTKVEDGTVLYENDFESGALADEWTAFDAADGEWTTLVNGEDWHNDVFVADDESDHGYVLKIDYQCTTMTGGAVILTDSIANSEWTDYKFEFDARKDGGAEGFMPYFAVETISDPAKANFVRWNQGGWTNTLTAFQSCSSGSLSTGTQVSDIYTLGQWYHVEIFVIDNVIYGMVDGNLINYSAR